MEKEDLKEVPAGIVIQGRNPREIFDNSARSLAWALASKGAIVLVKDQDGRVGLVTHGFDTHAEVNELLTVGIHLNLTQHDQQVAQGAAGNEAQQRAATIAKENA